MPDPRDAAELSQIAQALKKRLDEIADFLIKSGAVASRAEAYRGIAQSARVHADAAELRGDHLQVASPPGPEAA